MRPKAFESNGAWDELSLKGHKGVVAKRSLAVPHRPIGLANARVRRVRPIRPWRTILEFYAEVALQVCDRHPFGERRARLPVPKAVTR